MAKSALEQAKQAFLKGTEKVRHFMVDQPFLSPLANKQDVTLPGIIRGITNPEPIIIYNKNAQNLPNEVQGTQQSLTAPIENYFPDQIQTPPPMPISTTLARNPDISKFNISEPIKLAIFAAAKKFNVPPQLMFDIALQESSFDQSLVNPNAELGLNPTGLYQFTDATWNGGYDSNGRWIPGVLEQYANNPQMGLYGVLPNENRTDPYTNALTAAYLISNGQLGKWDASEGVWGNYWTPQELEESGFYKQSLHHIPGTRASVRLSESNR